MRSVEENLGTSELISRSGRDHFGKDLISSKYRAGIIDIQGSSYLRIYFSNTFFISHKYLYFLQLPFSKQARSNIKLNLSLNSEK